MKTVKEASLDLEVSTTTIYNHMKKLKGKIQPCISEIKGITYLNNEGIRLIKISMGLLEVPEVNEDISLDKIIEDISSKVTKDTNKSYDELKNEVNEIKKQNELLIKMMQDKKNKTLLDKFKELFKYE